MDLNVDVTVLVGTLPLVSDADGKTPVTNLQFDTAGLSLFWVFRPYAGDIVRTALSPLSSTPAADYYFQNIGGGFYKVLIPAELNIAEGIGYVQGFATGVLPFIGPEYDFNKIKDSSFDKTSAAFKGLVMFGGGKSTFNTADNKSTYYDAAGSTIVFSDARTVAGDVVTRTVT